MKSLIRAAALALVAVPSLALAGGSTGYYDWQWSFSNADPSMNSSGPLTPGVTTIYLWYTGCNGVDPQPGMTAAEMDVNVSGDLSLIAAFSPSNGFLNAGNSNEKLLLVVGGCPAGPLVAGNYTILVGGAGEGTIGLRESTDNGFALVVDCTNPQDGWTWPQFVRFQGAGTTGGGTIQNHGAGCGGVVSVESETWGAIKGLYR
jgi:hypothetical protein